MMSNLKIKEKGKYVSRAAFAKLQGEKNRLLKDIELMASGSAEGGIVWTKWRKHFKVRNEFNNALREIAKDHLKPKLDSNPKAFK